MTIAKREKISKAIRLRRIRNHTTNKSMIPETKDYKQRLSDALKKQGMDPSLFFGVIDRHSLKKMKGVLQNKNMPRVIEYENDHLLGVLNSN